MTAVLLSTAYFPPISYMASLAQSGSVQLEAHEHFVKQTYRNRATIYGANGKLNLVIPVHHKDLYTLPICQVRMAAESNWKKIHWRSIESAYRNSPFFEYYETALKVALDRPEPFLFHWNMNLLETVCGLLGIGAPEKFTDAYHPQVEPLVDLRNSFLPKFRARETGPSYWQVFQPSYGFIGDLSILDLLFNLGRESKKYLLDLPKTA